MPSEVAVNRTDGALAAQAEPTRMWANTSASAHAAHSGPVAVQGPRQPAKPMRPVQGSLFWEKPTGNVIPFESFHTPPSSPARSRTKSATGSKSSKANSRRSHVHEGQGELDFLPPIPPKPRTLSTTVEAVIFCEDPVATRVHRAVAAGCDWSLVLLAYGMFLLTYSLCGGEFLLDKSSLLLIGGVLPLLACIYGLTWAIAGYETPGMRWANLRLTTFDGFRPERGQRLMRFLGACLSLCTVVGMLWSLSDEESLAWPDHISGTFPTPRAVDTQVFHRR